MGCQLVVFALPTQASELADVTLWATPVVSGGITNFTIIYVTEQRLDFTWGYSGNATKIMIRGKYGGYPSDIPNGATTPSDGYLVYYGNATSANDTSVDFDQNLGPIYYKAWAQKADGTWIISPYSGSKESALMTLWAFIGLAAILSFLSLRTSFYILKAIAAISWWGCMAYWVANRPTAITAGSAPDVIMLMVLFLFGAGIMFLPFWSTKNENGQEIGRGFRLPFMKTPEEEERENYRETRQERNANYSARVYGALNGRRAPRRR